MTTPLRIALFGFGTVGSAFAEVLAAAPDAGAKITHIVNRNFARKQSTERARFVPATALWTDDATSVLTAPDVDLVLELMGGLGPAEGWLKTALAAGKHVVTANKQLIAYRGAELFALAAANNVQLLYGAAVAGGVPVIPGIAQGLSGDTITRLSGIVNGTCNFILSSMETGAAYSDALQKAQAAGYAEADPSADVDGFDARAKLCVLARLALHAELNPDHVPAQTISTVSAIDFAYAKELGCTVRQVAQASLVSNSSGNAIAARVGPMLVPHSSPIAFSHGTQNMVVTSGRFGGDVVFSGHGAGGHPTAVAVMSDVRAIVHGSTQLRRPATPMPVSGDVTAPFYLRFIVNDEPGIVAAIAGALATHAVNIDSILQHRGHEPHRLPFVVTTEPCSSATLTTALAQIATLPFMVEAPLCLQILTVDDKATD